MAFNDHADEVFEAIRAYLGDGIDTAGAWSDAPLRYPNEAFTPPDGPWVDFEIEGSLFGQQSIGEHVQADNRWDEEGRIWLHVMVPTGSGGARARGAAKRIAGLFRGKTLLSNQLEFLDASIGAGSPGDENGAWFMISVSIDWRHWDA